MTDSTHWAPGTPVVWRSEKDGIVRTAQPVRVVRDEDALIALYLCPGTVGRGRKGRRGGPRGRNMLPDGWAGEYEDRVWRGNRVLVLHSPGAAHSVWLFWRESDGEFQGWYINLEAPWRRTSLGFDTLDQVLDVVVAPDLSSWTTKDEDELAWAQEVGLVTPDEAAAIRAEAERAIAQLEHRAPPYCDGWQDWTPDPSWPVPELPANWQDPA